MIRYKHLSHGTGGLAQSVKLITEAAPDAVISDNIFDCYEEDASSSQEEIRSWAEDIISGNMWSGERTEQLILMGQNDLNCIEMEADNYESTGN